MQTIAATQGIEGEIEDVIGFVIREMDEEKVQVFVDGGDETNFLGEFVKEWNAPEAESPCTITEIETDVAATKDGFGAIGEFRFIEPALDLALAGGEFFS